MDIEKLIEEVKKYPCLYDTKNSAYNYRAYKAEVWEKIADVLETTPETAKHEWKKMYRKRIYRHGSNYPLISAEDRQLSFLDKCITLVNEPPLLSDSKSSTAANVPTTSTNISNPEKPATTSNVMPSSSTTSTNISLSISQNDTGSEKTQTRSRMEPSILPMRSHSSTSATLPSISANNFNPEKPAIISNVMPSSPTTSTNISISMFHNDTEPEKTQNWSIMVPPLLPMKSNLSTGTIVPATSTNNSNLENPANTSNNIPSSSTTSTNTSISTSHNDKAPEKTQHRSGMEPSILRMGSNSSTGTIEPTTLSNNFNSEKPATTSNDMPSLPTIIETVDDNKGPDILDLLFKILSDKVRKLPQSEQVQVMKQFNEICDAAPSNELLTSWGEKHGVFVAIPEVEADWIEIHFPPEVFRPGATVATVAASLPKYGDTMFLIDY